jgi:hypothetical protein
METNEITEHLFRVYAFVRDQRRWVTAHDIEIGANVAPRTARARRGHAPLLALDSLLSPLPELARKAGLASSRCLRLAWGAGH